MHPPFDSREGFPKKLLVIIFVASLLISVRAKNPELHHQVQVSIFVKGDPIPKYCSASAFDDHYMLTSAHCFFPKDENRNPWKLDNVTFIVGSMKLDEGTKYNTTGVFTHRHYKAADIFMRKNFDVALIFTPDVIPQKNQIRIASSAPWPDETIFIGGFGDSLGKGELFKNIKTFKVKITKTVERILELDKSIGHGNSGAGLLWMENNQYVLGGVYGGNAITANQESITFAVIAASAKEWIEEIIETNSKVLVDNKKGKPDNHGKKDKSFKKSNKKVSTTTTTPKSEL